MFEMSNPERGLWLPVAFDLTDEQGYFIDYNGERSRVVHQYDRFGVPFDDWVSRKFGKLGDAAAGKTK